MLIHGVITYNQFRFIRNKKSCEVKKGIFFHFSTRHNLIIKYANQLVLFYKIGHVVSSNQHEY